MAIARKAVTGRTAYEQPHRAPGEPSTVLGSAWADSLPPAIGPTEMIEPTAIARDEAFHDLDTVERARLEGVRLAAREMAHLLNNDLAVAVGLVDLLHEQPDLPPHLRDFVAGAASSLDAAARHIEAFQRIVRVATKGTPAGVTLDLERSGRSVQH
ncbi:MAG: hypothetical protein IT305_08600 [Chloroflexi bacterium]|nr:hypothetical protein [Chloroflexota bacterium]